MRALVSPFPDSLRQPSELFTAKIRCRVPCTKRFCCSAAKPKMHIARIESLRVFEAAPHYLCNYNDRELRFSHDLAMPVFGHPRIDSPPYLAVHIRAVLRQSGIVRWIIESARKNVLPWHRQRATRKTRRFG